MRYAIVESGGKQYRAVEGELLEVDRLPDEAGKQINIGRILLLSDGDRAEVGLPMLDGIEVKATIVDHVRGPKVRRFRYSPKKRIRVRGGHRQEYTRLMVDFIGGRGEERRVERAAPQTTREEPPARPSKKVATKKAATKKSASAKPAAKKAGK